MEQLTEVLQEGVSLHQVLLNLQEREKHFREGISYGQRGEMLTQLFPQISKAQIAQGEAYCQGMAIFPGSAEPHFIGNPVKWHENPFNDAEYTYFLHRMDHWRSMLEAYSLTGEDKYARKVMEEFHDWILQCPRQSLYHTDGTLAPERFAGCSCNQGIWRALEAGIRMYRTWPHIIHHLIDTDYIDESFLEVYLASVYQHAEVLSKISPLLWPEADHNHYLMENNGLLYLSCMFPEFKDAETWKAQALRELERSMQVQVTSGGGQIEGCPSYHNGCLYWFVLPVLLSRKYHFRLSSAYMDRLKLMVSYSLHATRPNGENCPWGDSNTITGTLTWGAVCHYLAFQDPSYLFQARCYFSYEELEKALSKYIWEVSDLGELRRIMDIAKESPLQPKLPLMSWQKELKQVFLRTSWSRDALYLMFACRTPIQNTHAHMDPAGFDFTAWGQPLLTDPAIFCFRDDEDRRKFKSIHWHNCLTLNHQDPWQYLGSWAYGPQQPGDIIHAESAERLLYATGRHLNYQPAVHTRTVSLVDKNFLLVLDVLEKVPDGSSVQVNFHMDSPAARADSQRCFACSLSDKANIHIFSDGQTKPSLIPARLSTKDDVAHDTMIARFEAEHLTGSRHSFLFIAYPVPPGINPPAVKDIRSLFQKDGSLLLAFRIGEQDYQLLWDKGRLNFLPDSADRS